MGTRVLRRLGKKVAIAAAEHFGPEVLAGLGRRAGRFAEGRRAASLGLTPTEHRVQLDRAVAVAVEAAGEAKSALERGECANAYEHASRARAFATVSAIEAKNAGAGVKQQDAARRAVSAASRASKAVQAECVVVPRHGTEHDDAVRARPSQQALEPAAVAGFSRRRKRSKRKPRRRY